MERGDFGSGKVSRLIMYQAIPLTIAQFVQVVYNIVDRIYLGHMPGEAESIALTGVGITFPIISLIAAFTNLFATGGAPLCSMARGSGDEERAKRIEITTLFLQIVTGIVCIIILFVVKRPLLFILGASANTYGYANDYLSIYLAGTVFVTAGTGMTGFINLQGFPQKGMEYMMAGAIINMILDPIFIFGLGLGVKGAALASVISQFISAFLVLRFLFGKKALLKIHPEELLKPDISLVKEIVVLGFAGFIMSATNCAVQAVCNMTLAGYGREMGDLYIAVMTIINSVREMIGLPINGITSGAQPVISYNYGASENGRVKQGIRFMSLAGVLYTALMWIMIMLFPHGFLTIFSSDERVIGTGKLPLVIYFAAFIFMSLQFAGQSTFVALGKAKQAIFFSLLRKVFIVIPLTLLLPRFPGLGVMGVFLAEPISNFIGGLGSFGTMYFTVYKKL
ncbi:MAG: MATE family efflux transporter [Lachnospiraceae bacterium]|nr:MATE family efflux transporter [Lachnospiraceae bacterium]